MVATFLSLSRRPATHLIQGLADTTLRPAVIRAGQHGLTTSAANLLNAPEGTPCKWRTARLKTTSGETAAGVFLLWLPRHLDTATNAALDAGTEPAGTILARLPGGMQRDKPEALAVDTLDEITGLSASITSRAVLVAGGRPVGIAEENWMTTFIESLAR